MSGGTLNFLALYYISPILKSLNFWGPVVEEESLISGSFGWSETMKHSQEGKYPQHLNPLISSQTESVFLTQSPNLAPMTLSLVLERMTSNTTTSIACLKALNRKLSRILVMYKPLQQPLEYIGALRIASTILRLPFLSFL